jgi:adhesin transport system membrane fusion protein
MATQDFKKLSKELSGEGGLVGSFLIFTVISLIVILIIWANSTELDNVTRGQGKVVSSLQNQLVQSSETGVLKAKYVEEGDRVSTGQLLFEIDPIEAKTAYEQAQQRLASLKIQEIRLFAEIDQNDPVFPEDLVMLAPSVVNTEKALFASRKADLLSRLAILEQKLNQRNQQLDEIDVVVKTSDDTLSLVQLQLEIIEPLVKAGLSPETELLTLKRQAADFKGKRQGALASINRITSSINEVKEEILSLRQNYATKSQQELSEIVSQIAEIESRIPALKDRVSRTLVKSPLDGIVNRLNFNNTGGFVRPGDVIVEIVPTGDDLIVEGKIDPKDIAYINPGQKVKISLTAYDAARYGSIDGKVLKVSADATADDQRGLSFYTIDVSMETQLFEDDDRAVEIIPGMVASIDVLAGKRTILEYFWRPMAKVKERAFRD